MTWHNVDHCVIQVIEIMPSSKNQCTKSIYIWDEKWKPLEIPNFDVRFGNCSK